jgi:hypothetical protein
MKRRWLAAIALVLCIVFSMTGCEFFDNEVNELNGEITGNTYEAKFYSNDGELFMTMSGEKIDLSSNIVKERTYTDGSWGYTQTLSSVVTITIDGNQMVNCGSTVIFAEKGLEPDVDYMNIDSIESTADGISDNTLIAGVVNKYKNLYGKPMVVVIQSQLGDPICAYSGESVYWEVCEDLPKTTKLMIDGKALYIHRANFQLIDKELLD